MNCGLSHTRLTCPSHYNPCLQGGYRARLIPPLKATVSGSIRDVNVPRGAATNTYAISVRGLILFPNVIFVAQPKHPVFSPNLPSPSPHKLPTPVKVERLRLLLDGYTPSTVEFLNRVLLVAFHFTFKVSPNRAEQIICCQPLRILWQLT